MQAGGKRFFGWGHQFAGRVAILPVNATLDIFARKMLVHHCSESVTKLFGDAKGRMHFRPEVKGATPLIGNARNDVSPFCLGQAQIAVGVPALFRVLRRLKN